MSSIKKWTKIKDNKEFSYVYNKAQRWHTKCIVVFFLKNEDCSVGFTASKRVGNAVKRNFAKRRMREIFRKFDSNLKNGKFVLVAKNGIDQIQFHKLENDFLWACKKMGCILDEKNSTDDFKNL